MKDFLSKLRQRFADLFGKMERGQLIRLIVLAVVIIGIVVGAVLVMGKTEYATLFSGMTEKETGEIYDVLKGQGVDVRVKGTNAVEVPANMVDQLIVNLAAQNSFPKTGLTYEYVGMMSGFGMTEAEKKQYENIQKQENLRSLLKLISKVKDAVVLITPSNQSGYVISEGNYPASASVMLELNGDKLTKPEAQQVARIVASAVKGLMPEDVEITDSSLNIYNDLTNNSAEENAATQETLRQSTQDRIQDQLKNLLALVFGEGKVGVMVNVKLDFDKAVSESQVFSPPVEGSEEGLVISLKELTETITGGTASGGVVGQDANGTAPSYPQVNTNSDQVYNKATREANMEINSIKTQLEKSPGQISDLSVSVILNSGEEDVEDYTPQVKNIVMQALGISEDKIAVERLPFNTINQAASAISEYQKIMEAVQQSSLIRTIIIAVAVIVVVLLIMMMLRTMFKKPKPDVAAMQLSGGAGQYVDVDTGELMDISDEEAAAELSVLGASGKTLSREQIENFIERDPESAAQLLRNWLSDI